MVRLLYLVSFYRPCSQVVQFREFKNENTGRTALRSERCNKVVLDFEEEQ